VNQARRQPAALCKIAQPGIRSRVTMEAHLTRLKASPMWLLLVLLVLIVLLVIPRLLFSSSLSRDVDGLGTLSERWLAEHRSSRQP